MNKLFIVYFLKFDIFNIDLKNLNHMILFLNFILNIIKIYDLT